MLNRGAPYSVASCLVTANLNISSAVKTFNEIEPTNVFSCREETLNVNSKKMYVSIKKFYIIFRWRKNIYEKSKSMYYVHRISIEQTY